MCKCSRRKRESIHTPAFDPRNWTVRTKVAPSLEAGKGPPDRLRIPPEKPLAERGAESPEYLEEERLSLIASSKALSSLDVMLGGQTALKGKSVLVSNFTKLLARSR